MYFIIIFSPPPNCFIPFAQFRRVFCFVFFALSLRFEFKMFMFVNGSIFQVHFCFVFVWQPLYHKHKMMKRTKERKKKNNTKQNKMMIRSQCRRYFCVQYAVTCIQSLCISRQIVSSIMLLQKHQVERTKFHLTSSMKEKREMIRIQTYKCVCVCVCRGLVHTFDFIIFYRLQRRRLLCKQQPRAHSNAEEKNLNFKAFLFWFLFFCFISTCFGRQ